MASPVTRQESSRHGEMKRLLNAMEPPRPELFQPLVNLGVENVWEDIGRLTDSEIVNEPGVTLSDIRRVRGYLPLAKKKMQEEAEAEKAEREKQEYFESMKMKAALACGVFTLASAHSAGGKFGVVAVGLGAAYVAVNCGCDPLADVKKRAELAGLKPSALKKRAKAAGVDEAKLSEADDADDVKATLIDLILNHE